MSVMEDIFVIFFIDTKFMEHECYGILVVFFIVWLFKKNIIFPKFSAQIFSLLIYKAVERTYYSRTSLHTIVGTVPIPSEHGSVPISNLRKEKEFQVPETKK